MTEVAEHRFYPRREMTDETIFVMPRQKGRVYGIGIITDISYGGVGLRSGFPPKIGERLVFEGLNGLCGPRAAYVRWVENENSVDSFKMGLVFG